VSWIGAAWDWYAAHSDKINPIVAGLGGAALVWAAIRQARTATRRHYEQTRSDQQRRLTESFSKAVEQLASDKIEARLGGIYTLERLAIEAIAQVRSFFPGGDAFYCGCCTEIHWSGWSSRQSPSGFFRPSMKARRLGFLGSCLRWSVTLTCWRGLSPGGCVFYCRCCTEIPPRPPTRSLTCIGQ